MENMGFHSEQDYEEFIDRVFALYEHPSNRKKLGQIFFNRLKKERPDISGKIHNTLFDPSKHDRINKKIDDFVYSLWCENPEGFPPP